MTTLQDLNTPCALIDLDTMRHNIQRMQQRIDSLGPTLRPHVKTSKSLPVVQEQLTAGARGITVSTLKEAEEFFDAGIRDILYAVCISPAKLDAVLQLRRRGCDLKVITDSEAAAREIVAHGRANAHAYEVWIEIDVDGHRSGIAPDDDALIAVASILHEGTMQLGGVMAHAGSSYDCATPQALVAVAEQERAGTVAAAERLRAAGFACPVVSIGSTPTALSAQSLSGVTEVRAGVYVFFDLVMHNVGVCRPEELALSVLTTVIGHQKAKGWAIVDAGWMAMSRDRGSARQQCDFGYGMVCDEQGHPIDGYLMSGANQEHGIVSLAGGVDPDIESRFPVGTRIRLLPNHACATAAQHPQYQVIEPDGSIRTWSRFYGW
jgi:D-serine deaminase-like pyridoxal phosphate-dependent protein